MEKIDQNWYRDFEWDYEIHVMPCAAIRNGAQVPGLYGYHVKILPPGTDPSAPEAWVQYVSGEGVGFPTKREALDAGVASARRRIFDEFGEPDIPSEGRRAG